MVLAAKSHANNQKFARNNQKVRYQYEVTCVGSAYLVAEAEVLARVLHRWGDRGVMRKAAIPLIFWDHTARKFMMSMTQYNAKIKSISVKWSEI